MYHKEDLAKLKKMEGLAPEVMKAFWAFDKAAVADGEIPVKYKDLIAVAALFLSGTFSPLDPLTKCDGTFAT